MANLGRRDLSNGSSIPRRSWALATIAPCRLVRYRLEAYLLIVLFLVVFACLFVLFG